jgi:hypothetical protein
VTRDDPPQLPATRRWTLQIGLWTLTLSVPAAALVAVFAGLDYAISLLLGVALGALNFISLTSAAIRLLDYAAREPEEAAASQGRLPLGAVLRWPAAALATAAFLWYMPSHPEALAAGVFIALLGLVAAVLQLQPPSEPPSPPALDEHSPDD